MLRILFQNQKKKNEQAIHETEDIGEDAENSDTERGKKFTEDDEFKYFMDTEEEVAVLCRVADNPFEQNVHRYILQKKSRC